MKDDKMLCHRSSHVGNLKNCCRIQTQHLKIGKHNESYALLARTPTASQRPVDPGNSRTGHGRATFCCSGNGGECTRLMHGYAKIGQFFKSSYREIIYISGVTVKSCHRSSDGLGGYLEWGGRAESDGMKTLME
jgi:hypothetical protein